MVRGVRRFAQVEEVAGAQEGLIGGQQGFLERLLFVEARLDQSVVLAEGVLVDGLTRRLADEVTQESLGVGGREVRREEHAIRRVGLLGRRQRTFDFQPLESHAGLSAGGERRVAISGRSALDIARERDG